MFVYPFDYFQLMHIYVDAFDMKRIESLIYTIFRTSYLINKIKIQIQLYYLVHKNVISRI
jgi:hypothetical protein